MRSFILVETKGIAEKLTAAEKEFVLRQALMIISKNFPETDLVVFTPERVEPHYEDEGRTFVIPFPGKPKIYVKLDDYGSVENLRLAFDAKPPFPVDTQYVVTVMLAEEY